jgi:hypothetical protein
MADRELLVFMDGVKAGTVRQTLQGNTTFRYDDGYRQATDPTPPRLKKFWPNARDSSMVTQVACSFAAHEGRKEGLVMITIAFSAASNDAFCVALRPFTSQLRG